MQVQSLVGYEPVGLDALVECRESLLRSKRDFGVISHGYEGDERMVVAPPRNFLPRVYVRR